MELIIEQPIEQIPEPTTNNNLYCIKCRNHTENVDVKEETIISKNKPRSVLKATCAVCAKKKNRFVKSVRPIEDIIVPEKVETTEMLPKKIKAVRNSTKKLEKLLQEFILGMTPQNEQ